MTTQQTLQPGTLEASQVKVMFDRIAGVYDWMNELMTAGLHHRWRRRAADLAQVAPGGRVLDVATGTGDLAIELASRVGPDGEVVGLDFSPAMLARARQKAPEIRFEQGDALALPCPDAGFDAATVGFGARNFADLALGIAELARVVRPGGRVVILEITSGHRRRSRWSRSPLAGFCRAWFDRLVPLLGALAGDAAAYSYLPQSVRRFPSPPQLAAVLAEAGLRNVGWIETAGGIIAIHHGEVPAA